MENASNLNNPDWHILTILSNLVADFEEYGISISNDLLSEFVEEVKLLIDRVQESQLREDIKKFLIFKLLELKNCVEKYYYYGYLGIRKEILSTLAEIGIIQNASSKDEQIEENKKLFATLSTAEKINPVGTLGVNVVKLGGFLNEIIKQLPPGK